MTEIVIAAVAAAFGRDLEACFRTIERVLGEARVCGARLVVLPEGALGGYIAAPPDGDDEPAPFALAPDGPELARLAALARELTVCAGFAEDDGGVVRTAAACVSGDGVLGLHRRVASAAAAANQTGCFGSRRFLGGARIVGPDGDPLAATGTQPGLALARVDVPGLLNRARRAMAQIRDLRPDVYRLTGPLAA